MIMLLGLRKVRLLEFDLGITMLPIKIEHDDVQARLQRLARD